MREEETNPEDCEITTGADCAATLRCKTGTGETTAW
jgi:hypothetical protein